MMTDKAATDYLMFLRAGDIDCMQTYWRGGSKTLSLKRHPTMCERDMSAQLAFFSPQASPVQLQFLVRRKTFPKNTLREYVGEDISQEGTTVSQQAREYHKKVLISFFFR